MTTLEQPAPPRRAALELRGSHVAFDVRGRRARGDPQLSFRIAQGRAYGLVGESGCGKSTVAFAGCGTCPRNGRVTGGFIRIGCRVRPLAMKEQGLRELRGDEGLDGLPEPGRRAEPVDAGGEQVRVFAVRGVSTDEAARTLHGALGKVESRTPAPCCDGTRTSSRAACSSASSSRWRLRRIPSS